MKYIGKFEGIDLQESGEIQEQAILPLILILKFVKPSHFQKTYKNNFGFCG